MLRPFAFAALVLALLVPALVRADDAPGNALVVHEWGTFTSVFSSDGTQQAGVHRDDVDLPEFVVPRGGEWGPIWYGLRDCLRREGLRDAPVTQKMETPVTYFYADRPMQVAVKVRFPSGILTHWYPSVQSDGPAFPIRGQRLADGVLDWGTLDLVPAAAAGDDLRALLPQVPRHHIWQFARETDSCYVRVRGQAEKYLFYRGLADFPSPVTAQVTADFRVAVKNVGTDPLGSVFILYVPAHHDGGRFASNPFATGAVFECVEGLAAGETRTIELAERIAKSETSLMQTAEALGNRLEKALVAAGLFPAEARAMRRTWHNSYFFTPGVRVLYALPQKQVDALLPIEITPAPRELLRVMVGRIEVVDPQRESVVETTLHDFLESQKTDPWGALEYYRLALLREGRFLDPILRTLAARSSQPEVATLATRIVRALGNPKAEEAPILGPDTVSLPEPELDAVRMTPEQRAARIATVATWLQKWEDYSAKTKCDRSGVRDAQLELALLRWVDEKVKAGIDPATLDVPESLRVLPLRPATCGCSKARVTGELPKE